MPELERRLERRAAMLARALPIERPWRRGRRLSGGTIPSWELHPDELQAPPRPGRSLGVDFTPVIRRRLVQFARDLKARRYPAAIAALDDAEAIYSANRPAIQQERLRDEAVEARRERAQKLEWSQKGREEWQREKAPEKENIVRAGRELRRLAQFAGPRKLTAIAKEILARDKTKTITVEVQQIRRILSAARV